MTFQTEYLDNIRYVIRQKRELLLILISSRTSFRVTGPATEPDPFRRYHSRSTDNGRLGLGLDIVQAISEKLGLGCRYQFEPAGAGGWHVFTLTLW